MNSQSDLREYLLKLLEGGQAHIEFERAVDGIPFDHLGKRPGGVPYSLWQQVEHLRIAQRDILEFSRDPDYESPDWPDGYWPDWPAPESQQQWETTLEAFYADHREMVALVADSGRDLLDPFPWGDGQTLFRQAVLIVDHNAYHIGQIVVIRKLLGNW